MNELINGLINDTQAVSSLTKGILQYNNYDLTSLCQNQYGIMVKTGNTLSLDNITIESFASEILDGGAVIDKRYGNKIVKFTAYLQGNSYSDVVARVQDLKANLNEKNGKLYYTLNGVVYYYTATCTDITIPEMSSIDDFIDDIGITFMLTTPNAISEEPEVITMHPTGNFEKIIFNQGNYKSYPKVILVGKTGTTITGITINLKNIGETGENLVITENIGNGDVLVVDYNEKYITLNGVDKNWSGFMTPLEVGANSMTFTFTGTADLDAYILYSKVLL